MGRIEADIALKSWLFGFHPVRDRGSLPYLQPTNMSVIVWLASHVLPYLSLWVGCRW